MKKSRQVPIGRAQSQLEEYLSQIESKNVVDSKVIRKYGLESIHFTIFAWIAHWVKLVVTGLENDIQLTEIIMSYYFNLSSDAVMNNSVTMYLSSIGPWLKWLICLHFLIYSHSVNLYFTKMTSSWLSIISCCILLGPILIGCYQMVVFYYIQQILLQYNKTITMLIANIRLLQFLTLGKGLKSPIVFVKLDKLHVDEYCNENAQHIQPSAQTSCQQLKKTAYSHLLQLSTTLYTIHSIYLTQQEQKEQVESTLIGSLEQQQPEVITEITIKTLLASQHYVFSSQSHLLLALLISNPIYTQKKDDHHHLLSLVYAILTRIGRKLWLYTCLYGTLTSSHRQLLLVMKEILPDSDSLCTVSKETITNTTTSMQHYWTIRHQLQQLTQKYQNALFLTHLLENLFTDSKMRNVLTTTPMNEQSMECFQQCIQHVDRMMQIIQDSNISITASDDIHGEDQSQSRSQSWVNALPQSEQWLDMTRNLKQYKEMLIFQYTGIHPLQSKNQSLLSTAPHTVKEKESNDGIVDYEMSALYRTQQQSITAFGEVDEIQVTSAQAANPSMKNAANQSLDIFVAMASPEDTSLRSSRNPNHPSSRMQMEREQQKRIAQSVLQELHASFDDHLHYQAMKEQAASIYNVTKEGEKVLLDTMTQSHLLAEEEEEKQRILQKQRAEEEERLELAKKATQSMMQSMVYQSELAARLASLPIQHCLGDDDDDDNSDS